MNPPCPAAATSRAASGPTSVITGSKKPMAADVWQNLRRLEPVDRAFGLERGTPIDRYYIEKFLDAHRDDIRGRVLEIGDATYIHRFGGEGVEHSDVLHTAPGGRSATIVGD